MEQNNQTTQNNSSSALLKFEIKDAHGTELSMQSLNGRVAELWDVEITDSDIPVFPKPMTIRGEESDLAQPNWLTGVTICAMEALKEYLAVMDIDTPAPGFNTILQPAQCKGFLFAYIRRALGPLLGLMNMLHDAKDAMEDRHSTLSFEDELRDQTNLQFDQVLDLLQSMDIQFHITAVTREEAIADGMEVETIPEISN